MRSAAARLSFIRPANRTVLAYVRQYENDTILCVANLSRSAQAAEIDLSPWKGRVPMEMLGRTAFPRIGELPYLVTLPPYGFFWFLLGDQPEPDAEARAVPRETITLVWANDRNSLLRHPRALCVRARRAAAFPARAPLVCREGARPADAPSSKPIIPLERDGISAALAFVGVPGERQSRRPAICCR